MNLIEINLQRIIELCRHYKVKTLEVFGSILTDRFSAGSDVDFLVDFQPEITHHTYADNFFGLYHALRDLLGREIDLVDAQSVKNPYFKMELDETKQLIYG
ncbi:MAG: nucleotidyltransferase [Bacteroides sp.]|nr:nucleotidyltransferase [Bacteroides sp.]